MDAEGKFIDVGTLAAEIEDADFGVWYTAVEARLGVWLSKKVDIVSSYPSSLNAVEREKAPLGERTLFLQ